MVLSNVDLLSTTYSSRCLPYTTHTHYHVNVFHVLALPLPLFGVAAPTACNSLPSFNSLFVFKYPFTVFIYLLINAIIPSFSFYQSSGTKLSKWCWCAVHNLLNQPLPSGIHHSSSTVRRLLKTITASSTPSALPSGSPKCHRYSHQLTLYTVHSKDKFTYCTYKLTPRSRQGHVSN